MPKVKLALLWFLSLTVALVTYRFMAFELEAAFPVMLEHILERKLSFILHIAVAPLALIAGLFQFLPKLRAKQPWLHRGTGRIYAIAVLVGGFSGLWMAAGSLERPVMASGFGLLAIIWLGVTVRAVWLAMSGRIVEHRRWMIRSFALTLAAVTLRLILPIFMLAGGMEYSEASNYVAWLCWVPNLIIAEWYVRKSGRVQASST